MRPRIGGTPEAIDQWVLNRVPWAWCSVPTIMMHLGVFGRAPDESKVQESMGRLVARKAVGHRDRGISMYKRIKEA